MPTPAPDNDETTTGAAGGPDPVVTSGVPAVVAVIPTRDPGPWFVDALAGLAAQEYPNLSVLVIDAGSAEDPTSLVASVLPTAFVRRSERRLGFAAAANEALGAVEGATFLLFCHDDAQLLPGAVQGLVSEAFRENAGIVGAKLVDWDRPDRLRSMGARIDKFGVLAPSVEPGELDQAQHDSTDEVAVVSTAAMLVRADLFADLGGFSTDIDGLAEDLDLCWRARLAGARIVSTPGGVARHRELAGIGDPDATGRRLAGRHQARVMLACYSAPQLVRIIPQAVVGSVFDIVLNVVAARFRQAGDIVSGWLWNLIHLPTTLRIRRRVQQSRRTPDLEVRANQVRGSVRLSGYLRSARSMGEQRLPAALAAARDLPSSWQEGAGPIAPLALIALVLMVIFGARGLFGSGLSSVREFVPLEHVGSLARGWWNGWRDIGLGHQGPASSANLGAAVLSVISFGSSALARTVVLIVALVLGPVGSWRALRDVTSTRARLVAAAATLAVAVPVDAVGEGRLQALAVFAAMPWILGRLVRLTRLEPFDGGLRRSSVRQGVGLGLVTATAFVVAPVIVIVLALVGVVVAAATSLAGQIRAGGSVLAGVASAVATVAVVHLPTTIDLVGRSDRWWLLVGSSAPLPHVDVSGMLRLSSGTATGGWLLAAVPVAAVVPLLVARDWRLRLTATCWAVALGSFATVTLIARFFAESGAPALPLLLAPAAAALAMAVGLGVAAFESDVVGGTYGWRQLVSIGGAVIVAAGMLPLLFGSFNGRWGLPEGDTVAAVATLAPATSPQFRTLWIGAPDDLPLRGRTLEPGLAAGITTGVTPTVENLAPAQEGVGDRALTSVVRSALRGESARLGRSLSSFGVRYIVVVTDPTAAGRDPDPVVQRALEVLEAQLDLTAQSVAPGMGVFSSDAWAPIRRSLAGDDARSEGANAAGSLLSSDPVRGTRAFTSGNDPTEYSGRITKGSSVVLAEQGQAWRLVTKSGERRPVPFQGWAQRFDSSVSGSATLKFDSPQRHRLLLIGQLLLLIMASFMARGLTPARPARTRSLNAPSSADDHVDNDGPDDDEHVDGDR